MRFASFIFSGQDRNGRSPRKKSKFPQHRWKQTNNIPLLIWPCSVQRHPPPPHPRSTPHPPPVPLPQIGTTHVFLACAWKRGHGTAPALLRGSQGLLETHDGHLAAVSEPSAWAGRGGCWHTEAATGEVGTGGRVAFFHMHCGIQEGNSSSFFVFFLAGKPPGPASVVLLGCPCFPELQMSLEFSRLSFSNVLP